MVSSGGARRGKVVASLGREGFAAGGKLLFPGREVLVARVLLQRRIALAQGLVVSAPGREEAMFHVEHAPVEISPAPARSFFKQLVDLGINDLGRELLGQICDTRPATAPPTCHSEPLRVAERPARWDRPSSRPCLRAEKNLRRAQ
jgi:hypothetical protein